MAKQRQAASSEWGIPRLADSQNGDIQRLVALDAVLCFLCAKRGELRGEEVMEIAVSFATPIVGSIGRSVSALRVLSLRAAGVLMVAPRVLRPHCDFAKRFVEGEAFPFA